MTTTADQCIAMGLTVGDTIVGRETCGDSWCESELTLIFLGQRVAVFTERRRNWAHQDWRDFGESGTWTLEFREWRKV